MTLQQMEYVVALDEHRHFVRAAQACGVSQSTLSTLLKKLEEELDTAIMATPLHSDNLLEVPLYYEKLVAYVSPDEGLASKTEISSHNLPSKHLWVLKDGNCLRNQVFNLCGRISGYNAVFEAGSIDTLVKIVDENGGYTVIPELHVGLLCEHQRINVRPLVDPEPVREISLVIRNDYVREKMLNEVASAVKKIIPEHMIDSGLKKYAIKL